MVIKGSPQNSHKDVKGCGLTPLAQHTSFGVCAGAALVGCCPHPSLCSAPQELLGRGRFPLIKTSSMKILVANPCTLEVLRLNTEECVVSARSRSAVRRARGDEGSCALAGQGAIDLSPGLRFVTAWRQGPEPRILLNSNLFPSDNLY